jgi:hypothetical protein
MVAEKKKNKYKRKFKAKFSRLSESLLMARSLYFDENNFDSDSMSSDGYYLNYLDNNLFLDKYKKLDNIFNSNEFYLPNTINIENFKFYEKDNNQFTSGDFYSKNKFFDNKNYDYSQNLVARNYITEKNKEYYFEDYFSFYNIYKMDKFFIEKLSDYINYYSKYEKNLFSKKFKFTFN